MNFREATTLNQDFEKLNDFEPENRLSLHGLRLKVDRIGLEIRTHELKEIKILDKKSAFMAELPDFES